MAEAPRSPFAGLDKALLRSTQPQATPTEPAAQAEPTHSAPRPTRTTSAPRKSSPASARSQPVKPIDNVPSRLAASSDDSALASYPDELVASIRKIVRVPGREVSFVRLTAEEKHQLVDIVYTYKRAGKKTTENEINRIAVNFILEDYRTNGEQSILARVIDALLA